MKYTKNFLDKVETVFKELDYSIIYGKGNFNSANCIVEKENKVVVNKFYGVQGRIEALMEILLSIDIDHSKLSPSAKNTLRTIYNYYNKSRENGD